jgi:UDP-N-acetyl-2-amino-2-deoxyglucuronate dehydrogenase
MPTWLFVEVQENSVHLREKDKSAGYLEFEKVRVHWCLSIDENSLLKRIQETGQRTYRSITINNEELEFSTGFTELHTESYQQLLKGDGFVLNDAMETIKNSAKN